MILFDSAIKEIYSFVCSGRLHSVSRAADFRRIMPGLCFEGTDQSRVRPWPGARPQEKTEF